MKKIIVLFAATIISAGILTACSSDSTDKEEAKPIKVEMNNEEEKGEDVQVSGENKENTETDDTKKEEKADTTIGDFKDQMDLNIGDTGQAESTLGKYQITVNNVRMENEINGESPDVDHFFVVEFTVKNIGESNIDAIETIGTLELTDDLEGGGRGEYNDFYPPSNPLKGAIEPEQSITGEVVFQGFDSDKYFIRTNSGLIAAGAVKNKTTWTFDKSEAQ
ncbi:hypothetical protein [Cytobacillus massiliigabonensis]|uniref:hypothetical protein n=1 Tax=Cytobacillus massiliigabonensis TaxID=1871011 RepID=UPI000C84B45C|nr:hypothetical protein [Cytobacillus massiliigabonensis]